MIELKGRITIDLIPANRITAFVMIFIGHKITPNLNAVF